MVAYNFKPSFIEPIRAGTKRQTIRLPRARHAFPGEHVQLFTGMRTKNCTKIIPDPVCVGVDVVRIGLGICQQMPASDAAQVCSLVVNGIPVIGRDADIYARADGFRHFEQMVRWWLATHGPNNFEGIAIRWETAA